MKRIVLIDNYDSFTFNLMDYLSIDADVSVVRNDQLSVKEILALRPDGLVFSPGPKTPKEAGITMELIASADMIPMLGVCLGHQALAVHFGAKLMKAPIPMHGKVSSIHLTEDPLWSGLDPIIEVMRYHSLAVDIAEAENLKQLATTENKINMAFRHKTKSVYGIQFHPESILSPDGQKIIHNWLEIL